MKAGREFGRDEMDERVVLMGDLDLTDEIIQSMDTAPNVARYLSITLSFKEDHVDAETLRAVVRDFQHFAMAAYRDDEYGFYAEAHLPRIKSYVDQQTGQLVERKPHIHIVIPKVNLLSGRHLEPLGYVTSNLKFIDAFQEHTNARYGFASPKDNRRVTLTDASEMISRYRGDLFRANSRDLKQRILDDVLDRRIERYDDFMALLREYGAVRMRNPGREDAYLNVKPTDADKGVNLKETVFAPAFIALPTHEKLSQLAADAADRYESGTLPRPTPESIQVLLDEWHTTRALEVKYLNSGSRAYRIYQESSLADRQLMLAEHARGFYAQHLKDHHERPEERPADFDRHLRQLGQLYEFGARGFSSPGRSGLDRFAEFRSGAGFSPGVEPGRGVGRRIDAPGVGVDPFDAVHRQFDFVATAPRSVASSADDLPNVPGRAVDGIGSGPAVLVPDHAFHQLEPDGAVPARRLRRSRDRDGEFTAQRVTGRVADNAASQLARDARQSRAISGQKAEFAEIRLQLDARRLLAELSHTHGVRPNKYAVVEGRDGGHRIRAGRRHLNVSDFLTKELNLPWSEAAPLLRAVYQRQADGHPVPAERELPRAALWRAFSADRDTHIQSRRAAWVTQTATERARRDAIRQAFQDTRAGIKGNPDLRPAGRRAATSIAQVERIGQEAVLRDAIARERAAFKARFGSPSGPTFAEWLRDQAQRGDERALAELRRTAQPVAGAPALDAEGDNEIRPNTLQPSDEENAIFYRGPALTWSVDERGQVTYRRDGVDVLRDRGANVQVLVPDAQMIETALRLAQAKYGSTLTLAGHGAFQLEAVRVAVDRGLAIQFSDASLNRAMSAYRQQRIDGHVRDVLGPTSAPAAAVSAPSLPHAPQQDPGGPAEVDPKPTR